MINLSKFSAMLLVLLFSAASVAQDSIHKLDMKPLKTAKKREVPHLTTGRSIASEGEKNTDYIFDVSSEEKSFNKNKK